MKTRMHKVLFVKDSPYKPKSVISKVLYTRKTKHKERLA
jgi:hypothetical protein